MHTTHIADNTSNTREIDEHSAQINLLSSLPMSLICQGHATLTKVPLIIILVLLFSEYASILLFSRLPASLTYQSSSPPSIMFSLSPHASPPPQNTTWDLCSFEHAHTHT
ncbi:hypothetical protein BDN70DRAFT_875914 [Pholiota conissans]|uniref:Uncharacterized protein n=1 Tax=Pholiota conissans TaxID=109636 RepID=A0A9P5Z6L8_9AGAR|nr:hypothetical protein BDN70DRAFT_875914 [Pholiota conissans]